MTDGIEIFVSRTLVPDADDFSWQRYCEFLFAEADFHQRSRRSAHRLIRRICDSYAVTIDDLPQQLSYFHVPAATVRKRLRIQGYTPALCRDAWETTRASHVERMKTFSSGPRRPEIEQLEAITLEAWLDLFRSEDRAPKHATVGGRRGPWHYSSLLDQQADPFVRLALLCDAMESAPVWMDCTFLYSDPTDRRTPQQIGQDEAGNNANAPAGKVIVLTEGKSDTRIITAALSAFYPEFAEGYQFLDFEEFRIEGGASFLARMVKTLSGARMQNRMLALFDNDAAGVEAHRSLSGVQFPKNVRLMLLPDTRLARRYPTLGPEGLKVMNVNGAGAPIELFLGRSSLSLPGGTLRPVRWTQWQDRVGLYQGVLDDKGSAVEAFEASLKEGKTPAQLRRAFPEMDLLLNRIFEAFEDFRPGAG